MFKLDLTLPWLIHLPLLYWESLRELRMICLNVTHKINKMPECAQKAVFGPTNRLVKLESPSHEAYPTRQSQPPFSVCAVVVIWADAAAAIGFSALVSVSSRSASESVVAVDWYRVFSGAASPPWH